MNYGGYGIKRLEHLISLKALEAMKDDGAGYMILGAALHSNATGQGAQRVFENYLYGHYNVVDNFEVAGDLYSNQGASFPVRVIVVNGRRPTAISGELSPKSVDRLTSWDDIWNRTEKIRNEIERSNSLRPSGSTAVSLPAEAGPASAENAGQPANPASQNPSGVGAPVKPTGNSGRKPTAGTESATGGSGQPPAGSVEQPGNTERPAGGGGGARIPAEGVAGRTEGGGENVPNAPEGSGSGSGRPGAGIVHQPPAVKRPTKVVATEFQIPYEPRSDAESFGTLIPKSIAGGVHDYLDELKSRVGSLDEFVAREIDMPVAQVKKVMAAEQIDGVAMLKKK